MPPPRKTVEKARKLRRALTPPEITLWQYLRTRPNGLRFRRQHPVGPYILDFYSPTAKLAIEIDGMAHDTGDQPERDARRDVWLSEQGIDTLRIPARDIMTHFEEATRLILDRCSLPLHHPADWTEARDSVQPPPHDPHGEE
jgi:very-short-patch-repair endonuclease